MIDLESDPRYRNLTPLARARVVFAFESDDNKPKPEYWEFEAPYRQFGIVGSESSLFLSNPDREPLHPKPPQAVDVDAGNPFGAEPARRHIPLPETEGPDITFGPGQSDVEAYDRWSPELQAFYARYNEITYQRSLDSPLDENSKRKPSGRDIDRYGYGEGAAADLRADRHIRDFYKQIAIEKRAYNDEKVGALLSRGYVHLKSFLNGTAEIAAFCEKGDRTLLALVLRMFAASFGERIVAGPSKDAVKPQPNKRIGFCEAYIELNGPFRRMIVVDLDMTFPSMEAARAYFEYRVRQRKLPCLPHFIVAARTEDGSVVNPHVYFLLNWNDGVSTDGRRNDRERLLFDAVERALIRGCAGDFGAAGGIRRKNPLSPVTTVGIFNQTVFLNLSAVKQFYMAARAGGDEADEQRIGRQWLAKPTRRELGLDDDDGDEAVERQQSNNPFRWSSRIVWAYLARIRRSRDPAEKKLYAELMADRSKMEDHLLELLVPQFERRYEGTFDAKPMRHGRRTVKAVCKHAAQEWKPARRRPIDHGVMQEEGYWRNAPELHKLSDDEFEAEVTRRRILAAKRTGKNRSAGTVALIADVVADYVAKGRPIEKVEIGKVCKLLGICSPSTVYRQWAAVIIYLRLNSQSVVVKKIRIIPEVVKLAAEDEPALPMHLPDPSERFWRLVGEPVLPWSGENQLN